MISKDVDTRSTFTTRPAKAFQINKPAKIERHGIKLTSSIDTSMYVVPINNDERTVMSISCDRAFAGKECCCCPSRWFYFLCECNAVFAYWLTGVLFYILTYL